MSRAKRDAGAAGSSGRLVFRAGYAKEIPVAPNQTIGIELLAGAGRAWGDRTEARSFRAGNAPGQFLYDAINSLPARNLPDGSVEVLVEGSFALTQDFLSALKAGNGYSRVDGIQKNRVAAQGLSRFSVY